jgi:hypothetical protein
MTAKTAKNAIRLTEYVMGQHGSSSFTTPVLVPISRIIKVLDHSANLPAGFSAKGISNRTYMHLRTPEAYMFVTEPFDVVEALWNGEKAYQYECSHEGRVCMELHEPVAGGTKRVGYVKVCSACARAVTDNPADDREIR